jgi:hypothetical protein
MFPSFFMNSRRLLAVRAGPRPFDLHGRSRTWSYARSPCFSNVSLVSFGDWTVVLNPRAACSCQRHCMRHCCSTEHRGLHKAKLQVPQLDIFETSAWPSPIFKTCKEYTCLFKPQLTEWINLHAKSSRNTLYFSRSACSSSTTSNRLPVKLLACTTTDQTKATVKESNHLILWLFGSLTCREARPRGELSWEIRMHLPRRVGPGKSLHADWR